MKTRMIKVAVVYFLVAAIAGVIIMLWPLA